MHCASLLCKIYGRFALIVSSVSWKLAIAHQRAWAPHLFFQSLQSTYHKLCLNRCRISVGQCNKTSRTGAEMEQPSWISGEFNFDTAEMQYMIVFGLVSVTQIFYEYWAEIIPQRSEKYPWLTSFNKNCGMYFPAANKGEEIGEEHMEESRLAIILWWPSLAAWGAFHLVKNSENSGSELNEKRFFGSPDWEIPRKSEPAQK